MRDDERILRRLFDAALAVALPDGRFAGRLPPAPSGRTIVLGAGKGAARMAAAFEAAWPHGCEGLVVTRYGHGCPTRQIEVVEAAHPVPDEAGLAAARRILELAEGAGPDDLVVALISGGASSLLTLPAPGIALADKQAITKELLACGAPIGAMNTVRKALSAIKGGRLLAAAAPAQVVTYLISDVPGDDPGVIGSGPTIPAGSTTEDALAILARYGIAVPDHVRAAMLSNALPQVEAGPVHMLATPRMALEAAAQEARRLGLNPIILGDAIEGEAREVGTVMAGIARSVRLYDDPVRRPALILSGGETTVTVRGDGTGGRNVEFLLALLVALNGAEGISAIACDTDGVDGAAEVAGAWFDDETLARARALGLDARAALDRNDGHGFFKALESQVIPGPTLTNVNDFRAVLVR